MGHLQWQPLVLAGVGQVQNGRYGCVGKSALSSLVLPGFSCAENSKWGTQSPLRKLVLWIAEFSN